MKELLNFLIKNTIGVEDYEIDEEKTDSEITYIVKTKKENMGLFIGKEGKTVKALRRLLKVRATLEGVKVNLILNEI